jgi:hypothetical protein
MNVEIRKITASDAVAVFLRAAEGMDPKIARAFIAAIETIRTRVPAEQLARFIERRDFASLENAFASHFTSTEWQAYGKAIEQAVLAGVKATSTTQGVINGAQADFEIAVGLNPRLEQFAITMTSTRIREIDQTTRDTIRQVLQRGLTAGDDPFAIARQIRGSIGLTRRQEAAVSNYERMLRALDPEALERKLRDRRSDGSVGRAIANDKALTDAQIRSLVDRYRDRYVKYRANVIARTESIRAVQGAQWELFQDMINKGQIDIRQVRRKWINTNDGHVRNSHVQIPQINPRGVGQAETFASPLGPILYPGDPSALAANTIQCRCTVFARIISRGLIPGLEDPAPPPPAPPPPRPAPAPLPAMTDEERRRRVWANKTIDERLNVAPAFMDTDPDRMAIIEKLGDLKGGVVFVKAGAAHYAETLHIEMSNRDTTSLDYISTMRHEYGHHIDAVIDRHLLAKAGQNPDLIARYSGYASRRALPAMAQDALDLEDTLTKDSKEYRIAAHKKAKPGALDAVQKAQSDLAQSIGLTGRDTASAAHAKLEAEFAKRGLSYDEAKLVAPRLALQTGSAPNNDDATLGSVENAVRFLVAYDKKDHYTLIEEVGSRDRGNLLSCISDSIGASTINQIDYWFGHKTKYYKDAMPRSRFVNGLGFDGASTYKLGRREYGRRASAQLFANWFEAWTSGNATQYALFTRFFPRTSKVFEELVKEAML